MTDPNSPDSDLPPGYTPTTTHAGWGEGDPQLRISRGDIRSVYHLDSDRVRVGSDAANEVHLPDTDPVHATIVHDERDEYVLTLHGEGEMNANPESAATRGGERTEVLRTGARFTAGEWTLVFWREEFADHGRPYGGRAGGELDDQPAQPARPDYGDTGSEPDEDYEVKDG